MFNIINENNEFRLGSVITVFTIPSTPKKIALISTEAFEDKSTSDLYVAYVEKKEDGYDYLEEIKDKKIFAEAMAAVKDIINTVFTKKTSK